MKHLFASIGITALFLIVACGPNTSNGYVNSNNQPCNPSANNNLPCYPPAYQSLPQQQPNPYQQQQPPYPQQPNGQNLPNSNSGNYFLPSDGGGFTFNGNGGGGGTCATADCVVVYYGN